MIHVETVRQAMKEKQLTPSSLAAKIGVHKDTVARWLAGLNNPQSENTRMLCKELGLFWLELKYGKRKKVTTKILCEE